MSERHPSQDLPEEDGHQSRAPHRVIGTPPPAQARTLLGEAPGSTAPESPRELPAGPDNPAKARTAEKVVATCFIVSMLASIGLSRGLRRPGVHWSTPRSGPTWPWACPCRWPSWPWAWAPPSGSATSCRTWSRSRSATRSPPPRRSGRRSPRRSPRAPRRAGSSSGRCCGTLIAASRRSRGRPAGRAARHGPAAGHQPAAHRVAQRHADGRARAEHAAAGGRQHQAR